MFALLICLLTLHQVHSACDLVNICTQHKAVQDEIVDMHNTYRREVQPTASDMLMMSYDEDLAASSQAWVDNCIQDHGEPNTRMLNGYQLGENMYASNFPQTWTEVIEAWHNELAHYVYPNGSRNNETIGHYTQVVWNSSYRVGCGVAVCPNSIYLYACQYYRAGNFKGWRPYKAGEPCASCPNNCVDKLCTNPCPYTDNYSNCPTLKATTGCDNELVYAWCPASCKCINQEIIPIY
uniref:cysteine-rich venom protein DIS2 n=1 Tax=Semicossyphus pulcher TaxID=241346 RepID=UPI0037E8278F